MEFNLNAIFSLIIAAAPALTAIISIIGAVIKNHKDIKKVVQPIVDEYEELKKQINDKTDITEAKIQMEAIMAENRQIRQELADLITALKKVKYEIPKE